MSKTYFGRCAAVGIAGLTAMSSIAIVASAATQTNVIYELKYGGIGTINMKVNGYTTGSNDYCKMGTSGSVINDGFVVKLADFSGLKADYYTYTYNPTAKKIEKSDAATSEAVWDTAKDFKKSSGSDISISLKNDGSTWTYNEIIAPDYTTPVAVKLDELYKDRLTAAPSTNGEIMAFKTESERSAAKNKIISDIKSEYTKLANAANTQFRSDINEAVANARARILGEKNDAITAATNTYNTDYAAAGNDADAKAKAQGDYNAATQTANEKYNAKITALNNASSKILSEFSQTFNANSFIYDADAVLKTNNAPVTYSSTVGGLSIIAGAKYTSGVGETKTTLDGSKYWNGSNVYNDNLNYIFKGEVQPNDVFVPTTGGSIPSFVFASNSLYWVNFEVIDAGSTTGGNTTPSGGNTNNDTKKDDTTTKVTTWYPDSAAYRAASEVSYLGKNGSWYTSASAATTYGGGYTGTSKNSNYSAVNSANNGKAIYFDSTSGTYTTTATSYSYVVKEATTTNDDPYYNYFFGNKNNNTTTSVPAGSPAISGASKYAGWTNISAYITNRAKSGATYTINMNDGTVVPAAVLAAAKAKNVTLVFANDNGSKITVKPGKVDTTSDLNVAVTYNVKDIKSSLVKKAKKVNKGTVSTAQVRIGTDGSIGGTETVTVKFSTKRAGCTVKAYRLTESGSLKKEASGTVASTGRVNLNLTKGGSYLLVVID